MLCCIINPNTCAASDFVRLHVFESGVMVLQLRSHSDEATVVETEKAVSIFCFSEFILFCGAAAERLFCIYIVSRCNDGMTFQCYKFSDNNNKNHARYGGLEQTHNF